MVATVDQIRSVGPRYSCGIDSPTSGWMAQPVSGRSSIALATGKSFWLKSADAAVNFSGPAAWLWFAAFVTATFALAFLSVLAWLSDAQLPGIGAARQPSSAR